MNELQGKVALVTGGGRGLGEAICRVLGSAGATVIVADIRQETGQKVAQEINAGGGAAAAIALDVTDDEQAKAVIESVCQQHDRLDILINNAGVDVTLPVDELPLDDWNRVMRVNLGGPFIMSRHALVAMKQQGSGHIVNVASTASKRAWANASAYHASKWGLLGFSHALHVEARKFNIKVTAVISGGMRTPFLLERFPDIDLNNLQDPMNVAKTVQFVLTQPAETVIPEVMVIPMRETSWP